MKRKGSVVRLWDVKGGKGMVSTESGVLSQAPDSFATRFENGREVES